MPLRLSAAELPALVLAALLTALAGSARARDLSVGVPVGPGLMAPVRQAYIRPYAEAAAAQVRLREWTGGLDALHATNPPPFDLVLAPPDLLRQGCDAGVLDKIDWSKLGRDKLLAQAASDCGVGALLSGTVLTWDRNKLPGTPSWADFFDIAKVPGKRGLAKTPRGTLEFALLADGVTPSDVYRALRGADGVDRAFHKLEQIRPYIVWWDEGHATQLLQSGEVLMTSAPATAIAAVNRANGKNYGMSWNGGLWSVQSWAVVKGAPEADAAGRFLAWAIDPKNESGLAALALGAPAKGALDGAPPEQLALSPSAPENLPTALQIDDGFWRDNGEKLRARFNEWLAH
jgi:putative spermidine/putrescine transport system substrate-binding protein